jgi:hypothetical protein
VVGGGCACAGGIGRDLNLSESASVMDSPNSPEGAMRRFFPSISMVPPERASFLAPPHRFPGQPVDTDECCCLLHGAEPTPNLDPDGIFGVAHRRACLCHSLALRCGGPPAAARCPRVPAQRWAACPFLSTWLHPLAPPATAPAPLVPGLLRAVPLPRAPGVCRAALPSPDKCHQC